MKIGNRIRKLSDLPSRFNIMLEEALLVVRNPQARDNLCTVACIVSNAAWQHWQAWRLPEDNRQEHEWVVFANVMRIAESEKLSLTNRRIATAFCFIHDTFFIKRIMEEEISKMRRQGRTKEATALERMKKHQRSDHMKGGADNAKFLLKQLKHPDALNTPLFRKKEIDLCADIVAQHDSWKLKPPVPPSTRDRLAVACLEGDALWPLHPIGVLADLDRPKKGKSKNMFDPLKWRTQLKQSHQNTLVEFRTHWEKKAKPPIPKTDFIDNKTIFRTKEGHKIYTEWRTLWNL